jgi:long-chain acyl-CoA synthetase
MLPEEKRTEHPANPMSLAEANSLLTARGAPFEIEDIVDRGTLTRVWRNQPQTFRDALDWMQRFAAREFIVYEDERITYEAFHRAVGEFACQLTEAGVTKGDRVALALPNVPEWPLVFFAATAIGAIATPLNVLLSGDDLAFHLRDCGAVAVVADGERAERLADALDDCPGLKCVWVTRSSSAFTHPKISSLGEILSAPNRWDQLPRRDLPNVDLSPDDPATLFYTSGTTGRPKGALGAHRTVICPSRSSWFARARAQAIAVGHYDEEAFFNGPPHVALTVVPLSHVSGSIGALIPLALRGGKIVFMRFWSAGRALELIEREKINSTGGVTTVVLQLLDHPSRAKRDLSSLQLLTFGGAPPPPNLVTRLAEAFPNALAVQAYGLTETSGGICAHGGAEYLARPTSCGRISPIAEVKIVDPHNGHDVRIGEVGEIWLKGGQVALEYWNRPEETHQSFTGGWLHTGDLGRLDEEGYLFIVDRAKDMVIRGGENIYSLEVENVLQRHPDVEEAALVGIPHEIFGEEPAAVVVPKQGVKLLERDLRDHARRGLAPYKVPVRLVFQDEPLPRNANGKVLKTELRRLFNSVAN